MKITLEYRNPTQAHCDVAVFVNGALTGTLRLHQEELLTFQMIMFNGCNPKLDEIVSRGNPNPN